MKNEKKIKKKEIDQILKEDEEKALKRFLNKDEVKFKLERFDNVQRKKRTKKRD